MTMSCTKAVRLGGLALALTFAPSATASTRHSGELSEITWRGESVQIEDLSSKLEDKTFVAIETLLAGYEDWVQANDYHVALSGDARVILITKSAKASKRRLKLVEKTLVAFDGLMTPPDRGDMDEVFIAAEWGAGDHVPDAAPVVLIEVDKEPQYRALLAGIEEDGFSPGFNQE